MYLTLSWVQGEIKIPVRTLMPFKLIWFYHGGAGRAYTQTTVGVKEDRFVQVRENTWILSFPRTQALGEVCWSPWFFPFTSLSGNNRLSHHTSSFVEVFYSVSGRSNGMIWVFSTFPKEFLWCKIPCDGSARGNCGKRNNQGSCVTLSQSPPRTVTSKTESVLSETLSLYLSFCQPQIEF